jgi:poly(3-hydroxybutyrate) depolymerase
LSLSLGQPHREPARFYDEMVTVDGGRVRGQVMLAGRKSMPPAKQYFEKYLDLYEHIEERCYLKRNERFERWYENPIDLKNVKDPPYLQARDVDDVAMKEQVFNARQLMGTPR